MSKETNILAKGLLAVATGGIAFFAIKSILGAGKPQKFVPNTPVSSEYAAESQFKNKPLSSLTKTASAQKTLDYCNLPASDPRYNKYSCGDSTSSESLTSQDEASLIAEGQKTYQEAFSSFQTSVQEGTATKTAIAGSVWTSKLTAGDGTVLYKDASGNIATKNDSGKWVITDSNGEYLETR